METQLADIDIDDLSYLERDLNLAQKVSIGFLLFGDNHVQAQYLLQKLLALLRAPQPELIHSDLLHQYAQTNPDNWRRYLVEALCIIGARRVLRKLGFNWSQLRLHYLPHVSELALHVHPLLKAMYLICEQLTLVQSGRLVMDINEQLSRRRQPGQLEEPIRFYDYAYLEIFMLDWLTRRHMRLGDINAVGSDVQLLIEYFKFNDLNSLATLLIQTINISSANTASGPESQYDPVKNIEYDYTSTAKTADSIAGASAPTEQIENSIKVRKNHAGILLIINQQNFHRDVSEDIKHLLPKKHLTLRRGTDEDRDRLKEVFSALGYTVEVHNNVNHLDILIHIRGACARSVLRDSLVVCILSHGFEGAVYGADSIPLSITDIQNVLCADENLQQKPKILIIQACQQIEEQQQTRQVNANTQSATQLANLVLTVSTVPGFVSLRHTKEGSWFIQTLCDTVQKHAASSHFLDILTMAFRQVSQKTGDKDQKMVPIVMSTLLRNVYLPSH